MQLRSGRNDVLYRGDLISGAIIASIVERAKEMAIKRSIASKKDEGISEADLLRSLELEYAENDIFPPTDITEDWLKLHRLRSRERGEGFSDSTRARSAAKGVQRGCLKT